MRVSDANMFVGVGTFAVAMLYFYVLSLSIVVTLWGMLSWWFVAAGWILLFAVLYAEKFFHQKTGHSAASHLMK